MKRVIDVVFAVMWLLITAPLIILIAILIRLESKGAIFTLPLWLDIRGSDFLIKKRESSHITVYSNWFWIDFLAIAKSETCH